MFMGCATSGLKYSSAVTVVVICSVGSGSGCGS